MKHIQISKLRKLQQEQNYKHHNENVNDKWIIHESGIGIDKDILYTLSLGKKFR